MDCRRMFLFVGNTLNYLDGAAAWRCVLEWLPGELFVLFCTILLIIFYKDEITSKLKLSLALTNTKE